MSKVTYFVAYEVVTRRSPNAKMDRIVTRSQEILYNFQLDSLKQELLDEYNENVDQLQASMGHEAERVVITSLNVLSKE